MVEENILEETSFDNFEQYHNSIVNCSSKLPEVSLKVEGVVKDTTSKFNKFLSSIGSGIKDILTSPFKLAGVGLGVAAAVGVGVLLLGGSDD